MAKKPASEVLPVHADDGSITTVKVYKRLARTITILAKIRDLNQQDLMAEYSKRFEDDLAAAMANRQAENRDHRKGTS